MNRSLKGQQNLGRPIESASEALGYPVMSLRGNSSARPFAEAVAVRFAVNDLIRLRPFAKVFASQAITANSLARLLANSVKKSSIRRLKTCGLSKFARWLACGTIR